MDMEIVPCNVCGAKESEQLLVKGGMPIARCRRCGLVYANPRLTQAEIWRRYSPDYFWDEYMPAHHAPNGEYIADIHRRRNLPLLRLLDPYRQLNTLLEVGCAAGFFLKVAAEEDWQVTGVEIMEPAVAYARETLGLNVRTGTLGERDLPAAGFDAVVMIETVEHLLDPAQTLKEAYQLLRPGGALLVTVPNYDSVMRSLLGPAWSVLSPAEHLDYVTKPTLKRLLRQIGFSQTEFIWHLPHQIHKTMNPHHTHEPRTPRSRFVKWGVRGLGKLLEPLVIKSKRTDRLIVLATKPDSASAQQSEES